MVKILELDDAENWIVCKLFDLVILKNHHHVRLRDLSLSSKGLVPRQICRIVLNDLWNHDYVESRLERKQSSVAFSPLSGREEKYNELPVFDEDYITLSKRGVERAQSLISKNGVFSRMLGNGSMIEFVDVDTAIDSLISNDEFGDEDIDSGEDYLSNEEDESDDVVMPEATGIIGHNSGEIVDFSEHDQNLDEGLEKIEQAIEAVRGDNQISEDVKSSVISAIESGAVFLRERSIALLGAVRDPIVIGLKKGLELATTLATVTALQAALLWVTTFFAGLG